MEEFIKVFAVCLILLALPFLIFFMLTGLLAYTKVEDFFPTTRNYLTIVAFVAIILYVYLLDGLIWNWAKQLLKYGGVDFF